jgi:hypothetical protein
MRPWVKKIEYMISYLDSLVESRMSSFHIRISESLVFIFDTWLVKNLSTLAGEDFTVERPSVKKIEYLISYLGSLVESRMSSFHIRKSESLVFIFDPWLEKMLSTLAGEDFTFKRPWVKKIEYLISYLESLVESRMSSFHIRKSESLVFIFDPWLEKKISPLRVLG